MKRKNKNDSFEKLISDYCNHLRNGFSPESFDKACPEEISAKIQNTQLKEKYSSEISTAKRCGRKKWESMIMDKFNDEGFIPPNVWIFCMKNLFGWKDKPDSDFKRNKTIRVKLGFGEEDSDEL